MQNVAFSCGLNQVLFVRVFQSNGFSTIHTTSKHSFLLAFTAPLPFTTTIDMADPEQPVPGSTILGEGASSSDGHNSGLFLQSRRFSVSGGTFTNVTNIHQVASSDPPDFRVISLGDLDLLAKKRMRVWSSESFPTWTSFHKENIHCPSLWSAVEGDSGSVSR
ncbi:hypothetical protein C8R47DRAFT_1141760 [Mycena vitilis]|nr:hypothetical protein C8R47DRAFT_1141760 [Mycena vitilis]